MGKKGGHTHSTPEQLKNLRMINNMTKEEASEFGRKGAAASNKKQKEKRTFKQACEWALSLPAFETQNEAVNAVREKYPDLDVVQAMSIAVMKKAIDEGDHKAYATIRDTTGELPEQTVNVKNAEPMTINIKTVE